MVSTETIRTIVGVIGNAISLGMFLSPVLTFKTICQKKDVEQFSPVPYLAALMNCMLWIVYGLPVVHPDSTLVLTINGAGAVIEVTYVLIFIIYSAGSQRVKVLLFLIVEAAFAVLVGVLVISFLDTTSRRSTVVGVLCVIFCILMYSAPLSVMKLVIQTKSVEFMPLYLSLASFFNGLCWTTYALLKIDLNILIPNGLGLLLTTGQLILYGMYYKSTKQQLETRRKGEIGLTEVSVRGDGVNRVSSMPQNGHGSEL